jgi:hypothetical protein
MASTRTRPVYLSIFEKRSLRIFTCKNGWCWEALTVEGTLVKRGPFPTRAAARVDAKKYAEATLRKRRSGGEDAKAGE